MEPAFGIERENDGVVIVPTLERRIEPSMRPASRRAVERRDRERAIGVVIADIERARIGDGIEQDTDAGLRPIDAMDRPDIRHEVRIAREDDAIERAGAALR